VDAALVVGGAIAIGAAITLAAVARSRRRAVRAMFPDSPR
jgi:hypothetical protein